MTVQTNTNSIAYVGNGSTVHFDYDFLVIDDDHLKVYFGDVLQASGYVVSGVGSQTGGIVAFAAAPASGTIITLTRDVPFTQLTDYQPYDAFPAESHERALDLLTMMAQQLKDASDRSMQYPVGGNKWDAKGNEIINVGAGNSDSSAPNVGQVKQLIVDLAGPESAALLRQDLSQNTGGSLVKTSSGKTVQEEIDDAKDRDNNDIIVYRPVLGVLDDTAAINDILANHAGIYFSAGVYNINPDIGVIMKNGSTIDGAGFMRAILVAKQVGATVSELAAYQKGSLIKRQFTPGVANNYVSDVSLDNVSIIMRHPVTVSPSNYRQIGVDLRNCDRSRIGAGLYVGNTTLPGMPYTWEPPRAAQAQGYGIIYGTRNSNSVDYCGGVGGIAESPKVYGARKNIVVDEPQLSPDSAAHATIIRSPDLQIGVELISNPSQYNAGTVFEECLLQSLQRFEATDQTTALLLGGYNSKASIRYLEGGPNCDVIAAATSSSKDCEIDILYASVIDPSAGAITDNGTNNAISYRELTAVTGGKTTKGRFVETFNKGYKSRRVVSTFVNTVGPQTVTGDSGVSVNRTAVGGYNIVLDKSFSGEFGLNIAAKTNPSRQGFSFAYSSKTGSSIHVDTYVNNALLDPEQMTIEIFQI